jgi:hypothetical protein
MARGDAESAMPSSAACVAQRVSSFMLLRATLLLGPVGERPALRLVTCPIGALAAASRW